MLKIIHPVRVNHINLVVENFDASVNYLRTVYGAEFLVDMPQKEWHACLIEFGRVIFELFVPHAFLLNARYGTHYLGIEYQADMTQVREAVASHGIRIARDIGLALHTHPVDSLGVAFEFYDGHFHDNERILGGPMKAAEFWRDEHPLGLVGMKGYTIAVSDIDAASAFLQSFLDAELLYESARAAISARAVVFQVADTEVEIVTPVEDGPLERHLRHFGQGIYSTILGVRDIEQARRYFAERDINLVPGTREDMIAVPAGPGLGIVLEFSE